eukprot:GGOE01030126.1.p3 GENE.GGOE01030126.1~~GGOE01030126.1.p3  ORF type:complete len:166 (-),score=0.28 GGOE01030126.1:194-691(-)
MHPTAPDCSLFRSPCAAVLLLCGCVLPRAEGSTLRACPPPRRCNPGPQMPEWSASRWCEADPAHPSILGPPAASVSPLGQCWTPFPLFAITATATCGFCFVQHFLASGIPDSPPEPHIAVPHHWIPSSACSSPLQALSMCTVAAPPTAAGGHAQRLAACSPSPLW